MLKKVLITVKAYPAISEKYGETVCTAGILENGDRIRIYPIPFRLLDYKDKFKKYDVIEIDLVRNKKDFRPESYRPVKFENFRKIGHIESDGNTWSERRRLVLKKVYHNMSQLIIEAKDKNICTSLATFKPSKIKNFIIQTVDRDWPAGKLLKLKSQNAQGNLFETEDENDIQNFEIVNKLPYKFSFVFEDDEGRESKLMIEDWETGALYWNSLKKHKDEKKACEDVKRKYLDDFALTKDYYFFLGTTKLHHYTARNPFVIIGDFRPKHIIQETLFE